MAERTTEKTTMSYGMNMNHSAVQAYTTIGVQTAATEQVTPHQLIQMLFEGVLDRIARAKGHMQRNEVAPKGEQIGSAITIVAGLRASLNMEAGGEIAANLQALYDYAELRLLEANLRNDEARLDEVAGLIGEIKQAWDSIPADARP
jgi:flagellar protein FliS